MAMSSSFLTHLAFHAESTLLFQASLSLKSQSSASCRSSTGAPFPLPPGDSELFDASEGAVVAVPTECQELTLLLNVFQLD